MNIKNLALSPNQKIIGTFLFSLAEVFLFAKGKDTFGIYVGPIIMTVVGLLMSVLILIPSVHREPSIIKSSLANKVSVMVIWLVGLFLIGYHINGVFVEHPINDNDSDVLAQVLTPSKAILEGTDAYQMVKLPSYEMFNTYLTMMWSPFVIAHLTGVDARWIPFGMWALVCTWILGFTVFKPSSFSMSKVLSAAFIWLLGTWSFVYYFTYDFRVTLELLPISYYLLLSFFLVRGNHIGVGVTMGFCLLSRFSIILFIPFLIFYYWKMYGTKPLLKVTGVTVAAIMMLFVLPFMSKDTQLPYKIMQNYTNGSAGEWRTHAWQNPGDEPHQLSRGFGLAIFAKKHYEWDVVHGVKRLRQVGLACSLLVSVLLIGYMLYLYDSKRRPHLLLGGLKLFLTVFYALVLIPYPYLFVLPLLMNGVYLMLMDDCTLSIDK